MTPPLPIRIGVMGCASIARRSVIPAIQTLPRLHLAGVASRSPEKGMAFAAQCGCPYVGDYAALLESDDIDAIYMPLPTGLHLEWAGNALRAGKHVLVEKSLASSLAEAEDLIALARQHRLVMLENYMFVHHAQQAMVQQLIQDHLGDIRLFRATFCFPPLPPDNFRYNKSLGGGALLDAGGYPLKACQLFMGEDIEVLSACLNVDSAGVDRWGGAMLAATRNGSRIPLHIAFGFDQFYQCSIDVLGQHGRITTSRTFTAGPDVTPTALLETPGQTNDIPLPKDNHFVRLLELFCRHIHLREWEPPCAENLRQAHLQDRVRHMATAAKETPP